IMSNIQTGAERMPHDLSHLGFLAGQIGRLITISTTPVIAGDSFEMDAVGALRLSPLRRGLAIDSTVDIFTFYVPHRHVYGEQWIKFMKDGVNATPLPTVNTTGYIDHAAFLGTINPDTNKIPKHLFQGYLNIYNNYFKAPWMPDRTEANPNELNQDDARYGIRCCQLKNIRTAPLPPETELSRQMTTSTTSIDIMGLQAAYANLHTDQERDYYSRVNSKATTQWRKTESANGVHLEGVASDNRSSRNGNKTTNLTSKEAKMGKVMRHTLCASLNIRHNLSSSKGPKPMQLNLLTIFIPKTSAFTLAFSTSQRLPTTRASARTFFIFRHYITPSARNF